MEILLKKQNDFLETLTELSKQDKIIQIGQFMTQRQIDKDEKIDTDLLQNELKEINKTLKDGFEKSKLVSNVVKLTKAVEKSFSQEGVTKVTDAAMGRREYRGIGERIRDKFLGKGGDKYDKDSLKYKFTTLRGFADMTGIVKQDSAGLFGDMLARREDKQKYIETAIKLNPQEKNLKQYGGDESKVREKYANQFERTQVAEKNLRSKEREINFLKQTGLSEEEIAKTTGGKKLLKERASLATTLGTTDFRFKSLAKQEIAQPKDNRKPSNIIPFPLNGGTISRGAVGNNLQEVQNENARAMQEQTDLLIKIEKNTRPKEKLEGKPEEISKEKGTFSKIIDSITSALASALGAALGAAIAAIGTTIAAALGSVAGVIQAKAKLIKDTVTLLYKGLTKLGDFIPELKNVLLNIEIAFEMGIDAIKSGFNKFTTKVGIIFESAISSLKGLFGEGSKIGSFISTLTTGISNYFAPIAEEFGKMQKTGGFIVELVTAVKTKLTSIFQFFVEIGEKLGEFGKVFESVSKIIGKIAYPLMVIMAVWDTVKGAVEGYEKDGIVGAIGGAIKGLFNSLIGGLLDMIKDGISWIAKTLDFKNVEAALDSFSVQDIFSKFVDAILLVPKTLLTLLNDYVVKPLTTAFKPVTEFFKKIKEQVFGFLEDFGIPEIGFTIPVIDKKVSIGPFYPFKPEKGTNKVSYSSNMEKSSVNGDSTRSFTQNIIDSGANAKQFKSNAKAVGDNAKITQIVKEDEAYQKLGFFDKLKVDVGYAKATDLIAAQQPISANNVAIASASNEQAKLYASKQQVSNTVVAPTTNINSSTQNQVVRLPARNNDPVVTNYISSRYN